jgi:ADP-ribose pyrophosphatase YjhB (NUDIX family)
MSTDRRFCRFSKSPETDAFGMPEVPQEGFCLSAFLVLNSEEHPSAVLMGHMNPGAPWDHLGALDPSRFEAHRHRWMLPSSHLMFGESPEEAARRILKEQLQLGPLAFDGPYVVSEVYTPRRFPGANGHWDLEFLFRGHLSERPPPSADPWVELRFVDLLTARQQDIARSHEDILASAGFKLLD